MDGVKSSKNQKNKLLIIIIALLAVVIVAAVVIIVLLLRRDTTDIGDGDTALAGNVYIMDESNYQQIQEDITRQTKDGYFETYMNTDWVFENASSKSSNAIFGNSPNNTKPIRMELILENTGEVVFSTGVLPVGAQLGAIKLNKALPAGTYNAVCQVYLMDENGDGTYSDSSDAGFSVTLTIQH